tara:strand:- start:1113 stop:1682 length:570 start_codon:yes stop_codon:yes gene_type:complete
MTRSLIQLGGQALKLDADGDTTIEVSSDDVLVVDTAGNEALKIDASGHVTKPLQPAFYVQKSGSQDNISNSGYDQITFDTERFDIGSNFASNTFTAPVTGTYHLTINMRLDNVDTGASYYNIGIQTSNRYHAQLFQPNHPSDVAYYVHTMTVVADMDVNDTAFVNIFQNGGTSQTDINASTVFCGMLIG